MSNTLSQRFTQNVPHSRVRVLILLLLFLLACYSFKTSGLTGFTAVSGALPIAIFVAYFVFKYKMVTFWALFFVNYFVMFFTRHYSVPIPSSLFNELIELLLIVLAIIEVKDLKSEKLLNPMGYALLVWGTYCTIELFNNTCELGMQVDIWYTGARLIAFQLLYAFFVCSIYVNQPQHAIKFLKLWAYCVIFATFWVWKQKNIGFTQAEKEFLVSSPSHNLSTGIRYFSTFTDSATFGCHMGAAAIAFAIIGITTRIRKHRYFFIIASLFALWAMFTSGTRTALFCFILGGALYVILSKSFRIAIPVSIIGLLFIFFLAFTNIANGNQMIRRMRSGFNRNDASASVRDINKATLKKYLREAPWGLGVGMNYNKVPNGNKYKYASTIPPDSEYVYIWVHTGIIGITLFVFLTAVMLFGACWITMFRIHSPSLRGVGAAFCCAFIAIQLGGYGNQILMQFPNVLIFYGGLSIVYCLPFMEKEWGEYEEKLLAEQAERDRIRLEKKRASRV